jgi:hypothetical protein
VTGLHPEHPVTVRSHPSYRHGPAELVGSVADEVAVEAKDLPATRIC